MILGMPARRIAAAGPITATWCTLPDYQSPATQLSVDNLTLTANTAASGTYANAISSRQIVNLGYYSMRVETNTGETAGCGAAAIVPAPSSIYPSNSLQWIGISGAATVPGAGFWVRNGRLYSSGLIVGTIGTANARDVQIAARITNVSADRDRIRLWIRVDDGAWILGGDPVTETTPTIDGEFNTLDNPVTPRFPALAASITRSGATSSRFCTIHGDAASTTGTVPSGFTAALWGDPVT